MIPIELTIEGMHSYRDAVTIPFEDVVDEGLFGIFGPTGSGKSTLLDAITLALYGRVDRLTGGSGGRVTPMLNVNAEEMVVDFTFELGGTRYRARRRFVLVDGSAKQRDAELVDLDDGMALASQARKVNRTVEDLLGMDFDQFTRAVFLPQGKFAQFLDDQPSDRIELLEDLFGLDRFGEVLRRRVRKRRDDVRTEHERLDSKLEELEAYDEAAVEALEEEHADAEASVDALEQRREALEPKVQQARDLVGALEGLEDARERRAALEARAEEIDEHRDERDRAKQARAPFQTLEDLREGETELEHLEEAIEELSEQAAEAEETLKAFLEERDQRRDALTDERDALLPLEEQLDELARDRRKIDELQTRRKALRARVDADPEPPRGPPEDVGLERARELVQHAAEGEHLHGLVQEKASTVDELEDELETFEAAIEELGAETETVEDDLEDAEARVETLETRLEKHRVEERAAVLVTELEDGEPCPVCGAREHPAPAAPPGVDLDAMADELAEGREARDALRADLAGAKSRLEEREDQRETTAGKLKAAREALAEARAAEAEHREALPGVLTGEDWTEIQEATQAWVEHLDAREAAQALEDVTERLDRFRDRWTRIRETLDLDVESPTGASIQAARRELETRLSEIEDDLDRLDAREDELREGVSGIEQTRAAKTERAQALSERVTDLEERLTRQLDEAGFEDAAAVEAAYREPERIEALTERIDAYDEQRDKVEHEIERLREEVETIDLDPEDAEQVREAWTGLEDELETARTRRDKLAERLEHHREQLATRRELTERFETVDEQLGRLNTLHGLLRGRGFVEYLAQARFDAVLGQASQRLAQISGGHYHLEGDPGEIVVVDHMASGSRRDLRTLSGGERFMVSLSLALALSDAIQNERGGGYPAIEFFFLDEGFGSLDGDTLDAVMHLLQDLAEEDIHVGLITHVQAAKRYVPARLEVEPADEEHGSRVRVIE